MTDITTADWNEYCETGGEKRERPADPGDVRFEVTPNPEPDDNAHLNFVRMIDDQGRVIDAFDCEDGYGVVAAYRECQEMSIEERLAPFGPAWQREQRERNGWGQ